MNIGIVSNINPGELREFLYDNQVIPKSYSMSSSVQAIVTGLIKLGHNVIAFSPISAKSIHGKKTVVIEGPHLKIYLIRVLPKIDYLIRHLYLPQLISRFIKKELSNLDVLHAQWTYECSAATIPFSCKRPTFCSVRDWWPVQYEYFKKEDRHQRILWGRTKRIMFEKTMQDSHITFVANSEYTKRQITDLYPHYNVPIIPNPIIEEYIASNNEYVFNNVFVSIANSLFEKRKNITTLLEAFSQYYRERKGARLILVGDYSKDDAIYKDWQKNNLLHGVEFCGILPHDQVLEKLDEASVMIHPSLEETFGNILLEGMARKLLVVGGEKSAAVPAVLGYGKYGLVGDVTTSSGLLSLMNHIYEKEDHFKEIVESSTSFLVGNLTDIAVAKQHVEMYNSFIGKTLKDNE